MKFLKIADPKFDREELKNVTDCINTGWISSTGKYVKIFESKFSNFCDAKYGVATCNGTTALHLALKALNIGPGDEVIVPTLTFIATANVVTYTGAKAVFVDSEPATWNIDADKIEAAITKKTKAIIPVHLYGHPAEMDKILKIAKKYKLHIIEDAAEAHGAELNGKKVGSIGDIGCFSFFGNKIITTGEGGMIVTNNKNVSDKSYVLRDHGMLPSRKYWHPYIGFNYRITNLQAAVGVAQLGKIHKLIQIKRKIAGFYDKHLKGIEGIKLPVELPGYKHVYWMYTILVEKSYNLPRNGLGKLLKKNSIDSRPMFYPIHIMPPYKTKNKYPVSEELSKKGLSLPSNVNLTEKDIIRIANCIRYKK